MEILEKKLKRKFRKLIKSYRVFCSSHGYDYRNEITLLWFFNRQGKAVKIGDKYFIVYKDKNYPLDLLSNIFRNKD